MTKITKGFVIFVIFVIFVAQPWAVSAQGAPVAAPGGAQMPNPKQMSGVPLPVPDMEIGTVTVRVIRGALANILPGQTVQITGAGPAKTATTDAAGRATFNNLPPGSRVRAVVTVDGERVESEEFAVPSTGGIRLMLVATDAAAEQEAAGDSKPGGVPAVPGQVILGDQSRFVLEVGDDALNVFSLMQIVNTAKGPVQTDGPIVFELPAGASGVGMLEGSSPSAVAAGGKVTVTGPFAPGNTAVQFAYSIPLGSEQITVAQKLPAQMPQVAVVAQKIGGMRLTSPQLTGQREMSASGETFVVAQGGALRAGDTLTLTLSGLPHRASWPMYLSLALAAAILVVGTWSAVRGHTAPDEDARRRQLHAERDKLFSELASLEAQRRKGSIEAPAYASRRADLVAELEGLYAQID